MKQQLNHFPILILFLCIFISCEKKQSNVIVDKHVEYRNKALSFESQSRYDSAYFYYNKAKSLATKSEDRHAYTMLKIAQIQQIIGDYYGCEETITEALATNKNSNYLPYFYNLLAISYHKQNDFESAVECYKKAVELTLNSFEKAIIQNNIGLVYLEKKEYQKAIETLQPLLNDSTLATNQYEIARVMDNLGYTQLQLKKTDAFKNLYQAWKLRDSLQDNLGLIASNMHLSEYYQTIHPEKAKQYADLAYLSSQKASSPDDQLEALKWLTEFADPDESKQYYQYYIKLNDSLAKARSVAKNQFAKIKYDSKKATQEVVKYKNQKAILLTLIGLILIIAFLLYKLYQTKNKRQVQQQSYLTETRISKRIHDELANDVYHLMTFTQTQNLENPVVKDSLLDNLENIYNRTRDISKENSEIRTDENFEPDLFQMIDNFSDGTLNVIRKSSQEIKWQKIGPEKKITVHRVVQEFLINTKKHSEATHVMINFSEQNNHILISYTDNGIGLRKSQNLKSGLRNAENRILAIKGNLTFETEIQKGFKATFTIPK